MDIAKILADYEREINFNKRIFVINLEIMQNTKEKNYQKVLQLLFEKNDIINENLKLKEKFYLYFKLKSLINNSINNY